MKENKGHNTKKNLLDSLKTSTSIANNIDTKHFMSGANIQTLKEFIQEHHNGSQSSFAMANGIHKQQVNQQLKADFIVVDGTMYRMAKVVV